MDERRHTGPRRRAGVLLGLAACLLSGGCAWVERDYRPTWNAFEEHLVPADEPAFSLALPLTVPGGLVALLLDIVIVHPIQVVDDAAREVGDMLWDDVDWDADYWTECALVPPRAVATGCLFVADWFVRAIGPEPPYEPGRATDEGVAAKRARVQRAREEAWLEALGELAADPGRHLPPRPDLPWGSALRAAVSEQLASDDYRVRLALYRQLAGLAVPGVCDAWAGYRDADPRVRALLLTGSDGDVTLPADLRQALLDDPDPVVAALAAQRLR